MKVPTSANETRRAIAIPSLLRSRQVQKLETRMNFYSHASQGRQFNKNCHQYIRSTTTETSDAYGPALLIEQTFTICFQETPTTEDRIENSKKFNWCSFIQLLSSPVGGVTIIFKPFSVEFAQLFPIGIWHADSRTASLLECSVFSVSVMNLLSWTPFIPSLMTVLWTLWSLSEGFMSAALTSCY